MGVTWTTQVSSEGAGFVICPPGEKMEAAARTGFQFAFFRCSDTAGSQPPTGIHPLKNLVCPAWLPWDPTGPPARPSHLPLNPVCIQLFSILGSLVSREERPAGQKGEKIILKVIEQRDVALRSR